MDDNQSKPDPKELRPPEGERKGDALIAAMQVSPYRDIGIEPRRDPMPVRMCRDRRVFLVGELPEETVEAIRRTEMDPRHAYLDDLIKDWNP